ncbi:hypothetical protein SAMN02745824_3172 [Parasphingorhabdus marina DSM 22363]|uniref:CTP synthetase n=1 Tax=Parasphingorhabdus marina DSM 22363 TaxID=1123272 RepID=A0A1N6H7R1_9SPHN|nr:hypothetical protein [Parasphingorhabdus marina]SIO15861.1 hypothetical protein SAMN02745824_3172 [Parasphingorhabdus marina DSM 22363]
MELIKQNLFLFNMIQFLASCLTGFGAVVVVITMGSASLPILFGCVTAGFILGFPVAWFVTRRIVHSQS